MLRDELAIARLFEAAGVLAEELEAAMESLWEAVLRRWLFAGAFGGRELLILALLLTGEKASHNRIPGSISPRLTKMAMSLGTRLAFQGFAFRGEAFSGTCNEARQFTVTCRKCDGSWWHKRRR